MEQISQAIILAAGTGKRLRPYTDNCPKPLLKIAGQPAIERMIQQFTAKDIHVIVVTGYMHEKFEYLTSKFKNVTLVYNNQYDVRNNAFSLYCAKEFLNTPTIICDADQVFADENILTTVSQSGYYVALQTETSSEWAVTVNDNHQILDCRRGHDSVAYIIRSLSYWTTADVLKLSQALSCFSFNDGSKYWDDIPLFDNCSQFKLKAYIQSGLQEFDTVEEYERLKGYQS